MILIQTHHIKSSESTTFCYLSQDILKFHHTEIVRPKPLQYCFINKLVSLSLFGFE